MIFQMPTSVCESLLPSINS